MTRLVRPADLLGRLRSNPTCGELCYITGRIVAALRETASGFDLAPIDPQSFYIAFSGRGFEVQVIPVDPAGVEL